MKLSINWLKEFISLENLPPETLADLLTLKACEVEQVTEVYSHLNQVVIGKVVGMEKHPDADKLNICQVDIGSKTIQIVTGANNVVLHGSYPVAVPGTALPTGLVIQESKLRGQISSGMMCSGKELGIYDLLIADAAGSLTNRIDGLMPMGNLLPPGTALNELFPDLVDIIFDIDNKSITHRPDLWSHFGFAREIGALTGNPVHYNPLAESFSTRIPADLEVSVNDNAAIIYTATRIRNIRIRNSSLKIQARLWNCGIKPKNNLVDISNYVLLETGQPNHVFDFAKTGNQLIARRSMDQESVNLLNGESLLIPPNVPVIANNEGVLALAGVMGGADSAVSEDTTEIILESATFSRSDIRKVVTSTGIRTDSSQRFEKGQDPAKAVSAIFRFVRLLYNDDAEIQVSEPVICGRIPDRTTIDISIDYIRRRLGTNKLSESDIANILKSLGCEIVSDSRSLSVTIPSWRAQYDLQIKEDLVEEIGRILGYKEISAQPISVACQAPGRTGPIRDTTHHLREVMANRYGFMELFSYGFHSEADISLDLRFAQSAHRLVNPLQAISPMLRISPLPGLLRAIAAHSREYPELRYFETERIYIPNAGANLPTEKEFLAVAITTPNTLSSLDEILSIVQDFPALMGSHPAYFEIQQGQSNTMSAGVFHPGRSGILLANNKPILRFGQIHPATLEKVDPDMPDVAYLELFLEDLIGLPEPPYIPVRMYPPVKFEINLVMDENVPYSSLVKTISPDPFNMSEHTFVEAVYLVSQFRGEQIGPGKKSVAVEIRWRNNKKSIDSAEVSLLQQDISARLTAAGFAIR